MSLARQSFIDLIRDDFKDPKIKQICIKESRKKIEKGQTNRAFDSFPHIVPDNLLNDIVKNFKQIIEQIKPNSEFTLSDAIEKRLHELESNLAVKGCFELLDNNGHLKEEFLEELHWTDLKDKIDSCKIVCSYVHTIHQQMMDKLLQTIIKHDDAYNTLILFVNANYGSWVIEQMKKSNYDFDDSYYEKAARSNFEIILYFPKEKPLQTFGIVAGIAGFAVLGFSLFSTILTAMNKEPKKPEKHAEPTNKLT